MSQTQEKIWKAIAPLAVLAILFAGYFFLIKKLDRAVLEARIDRWIAARKAG